MRSRIVVSLLLMLGFYLLALSMALALLFVPYYQLTHDGVQVITVICVVSGLAILWSILPRFDRFKAPGPRLTEHAQPELFQLVRRVSQATGQAMPADIFLLPEVNAWVSNRGGIMGLGSRRVMGIGLTLLQSVSIGQLRAIVAHEFGHYAGGDLRLGVWLYKTREAMRRTIENLAQTGNGFHKPFLWYANFFMRISQSVSRAQELAADRIAARIGGVGNAMDALLAVHGAALAYNAYWQQELIPVLTNGYRPPIAAGFSHFLGAQPVADAVSKQIKSELSRGVADPYDSHPPLNERIAALRTSDRTKSPQVDARAVSLLRDVRRLEWELLQTLFADPQKAKELKSVEWEETAPRVFLPVWRDESAKHVEPFRVLRAVDVPRFYASADTLQRLRLTHLLPDDRERAVRNAIGCGIAARLYDDGWNCEARPGLPVVFAKEGRTFQPFALAHQLGTVGFTDEEWSGACERAGISEMTLA
jgi:Zn-dependent protease with chaperone function